MVRKIAAVGLIAAMLGLGACENMNRTQQNTLSGGAIGAAGGALLGAVTGGSAAVGAAVGGAVGAGVGYVKAKNEQDDD
jgi:hypothetical protein